MLKLINFVCWILDALGRKRIICDHVEPDKPYLIRRYLLGRRNHKWFVACLHHILISDRDFLHSHPASYAALVLTGGYWEITQTGKYWRGPGSLRFRCMDSFHRIEIDHDRPVFTLFLMFRRSEDWYFLENGKAVPHAIHLGHESN